MAADVKAAMSWNSAHQQPVLMQGHSGQEAGPFQERAPERRGHQSRGGGGDEQHPRGRSVDVA